MKIADALKAHSDTNKKLLFEIAKLNERLEKARIYQEKQQAEISEISVDKQILLSKIIGLNEAILLYQDQIDKVLSGTGFQTIYDYIDARM